MDSPQIFNDLDNGLNVIDKQNTNKLLIMTDVQENNVITASAGDYTLDSPFNKENTNYVEYNIVDSVNMNIDIDKTCFPTELHVIEETPQILISNSDDDEEKVKIFKKEDSNNEYKIIEEFPITYNSQVLELQPNWQFSEEYPGCSDMSPAPDLIKKRKRILLLNDEESDQEEEKNREEILNSPNSLENIIDTVPLVPNNEKPKPKSKKVSTQILKELQARQLLQSAIIIPAGNSKKKKKRVLESDDDEDDEAEKVDIADIGLESYSNNEDLCLQNGMILIEAVVSDGPTNSFENIQEIQLDKVEKNILIDNSNEQAQSNSDFEDDDEFDSQINTNDKGIISISEMEKASNKPQRKIKTNTNQARDSGNSTDSTNNNVKRKPPEPKKDPFVDYSSSSSDEFLPNDIYFGTPDKVMVSQSRARGRPKCKSFQEQSLPHNDDCYDENSIRSSSKLSKSSGGSSRKNNQSTQKQNQNRHRPKSKSRSNSSFSSSQSSSEMSAGTVSATNSDSDENWKKSVKVVRKNLVHQESRKKPTPIVVNKIIKKKSNKQTTNFRSQINKKDRFYDRSREIPTDIYFGDIQVPLHILHSYGATSESSSESDEEDSDELIIPVVQIKQKGRTERRTVSKNHSAGRKSSSSNSLTNQRNRSKGFTNNNSSSDDSILTKMKSYLKEAGIQRVKFNRLWEGCKSNQERANKILDLLREKGLEGDPTIAKCRELKKQILTKREIEDLDVNAIIETEGRTRRSTRSSRAATKRCYTYEDDEEAQQTLTKIKKIVDSDSDYDNVNAIIE